jgi:hypothetical protein
MPTEERYNRLTVLGVDHIDSSYRRYWKCRCDCGNEVIVRYDHVRSGRTRSCGCLYQDAAERQKIHGMSRTPTHQSWMAMINRCYDSSHPSYNRYGGRGITVCERWHDPATGFINFLADMGERTSLQHSLDRYPNNDGDYEPGNCRWATRAEQYSNMTSNRLLTYQDRTQTVSEWSREIKIPLSTLLARLKRGWSIDESLSSPIDTRFSTSTKAIGR